MTGSRSYFKKLLERWRPGVPILKEQRVIAWDRVLPVPAGAPPGTLPVREEAELDVRFPQSSGRMLNVDIGFTDPYTRDVAEVRRRAREPGRAAAAYHKHARYRSEDNPTEDLVPFIFGKLWPSVHPRREFLAPVCADRVWCALP